MEGFASMKSVILYMFISLTWGHQADVPVVMWNYIKSQDLGEPLAGHTVNADVFYDNYLAHLSKDPSHNLIVFLQDELSLDDITRYANVYLSNSDGAAFHNLKTLMESSDSLYLPSVSSPSEALDRLTRKFAGHHTTIDRESYTLTDQALKEEGGNVVFVHLPLTDSDKTAAFQKIDNIIGSITEEMKSIGQPFSAIYTAQKSSKKSGDAARLGRHLLQTADKPTNTYFLFEVTGDCVMFYAKSISLILDHSSGKENNTIHFDPGMLTGNGSCHNDSNSARLSISLTGRVGDLQTLNVTLTFMKKKGGSWGPNPNSTTIQYSLSGTQASTDAVALDANYISAPAGFSYHCTDAPDMKSANSTEGSNAGSVVFRVREMQVEAFTIRNKKFSTPYDCVGFFSVGIWSGLIAIMFLTIIMAFGIVMLANINTMDRFDDPKGKTITVNISE